MKYVLAILVAFSVSQASIAGTTSYQYDALGRLSVLTEGSSVIHYFYDPAGNRTQKQSQVGATASITLPSSTVQEHQGSVVLKVNVAGVTTGTVSFYEGGTFVGSTSVVNGVATVEIIGLARGAHTFTVSYSGDGSHAPNSVTFPIKIVNIDWLPAVLEILMN